ncbi:hypothetical protein AAG906_026451 [Vitis piasezkii]
MFDEARDSLEKVAYMLKLPERLKLHPNFHVSFLKPYHEDLDAERVQTKRAPPLGLQKQKLLGRRMLPCGNLRQQFSILALSRQGRRLQERGGKCLMSRPCTHETLHRKQRKLGGLVVQTPGLSDSKEGAPREALTVPKGHHSTALGHRGAMPCAPRGISHGRNAMARCYGAGPDGGTGWCMLPRSEGLDQRHASEHPVIRGTLRGRRQLVRGTFQQLGEQGLRRWQCS